MVTMTHPDLPGQEIHVAASAVAIHRQSGWRTATDDGKPETPETIPRTTPEATDADFAPTAENQE